MLNEDAFVSALDIIVKSYEINNNDDFNAEKEKTRLFLWFMEVLSKEVQLNWRKYGDTLKIKFAIIRLDLEKIGYTYMIDQEDNWGRFLSQREEFLESFEFVKNVIQKNPKFSLKKVGENEGENKIIYELKLKK